MTSATPEPKFSPGDRVGTHECNGVATVIGVESIAPPYNHGVTGDRMPAEVWYNVRRADGTRGIFSELHLRR